MNWFSKSLGGKGGEAGVFHQLEDKKRYLLKERCDKEEAFSERYKHLMGPYRAVTSSTALVDVHCQSSLFVL